MYKKINKQTIKNSFFLNFANTILNYVIMMKRRIKKNNPVIFLFALLFISVQNVFAQTSTDVPAALTNIKLFDNGDGTVTLTWDRVSETGKNGGYVNPDEVTYNIYSRNQELIVSGVEDNTYTFTGIAQTDNIYMLLYRLTAVNSKGEGEMARSTFILLGPSISLPYSETAPEGKPQQEWWTEQHADDPFQGSTAGSSDDDGGCTAWYSNKAGEDATSSSAKISLSGAANPVLFFSYFALPGQNASFDVIINKAGREDHVVATVDFSADDGQVSWRNMIVPLSGMSDASYVVLRFHAKNNDTQPMTLMIDNIRIYDQPQKDVAVRMTAPNKWVAGNEMNLRIGLTNYGAQKADDLRVNVYVNGSLVKTLDDSSLEMAEDRVVSIGYTPSVVLPEQLEVYAEVDLTGDENLENNNSMVSHIELGKIDLPVVSDLSANDNEGRPTLTWTAPVQQMQTVNDGFEDYGVWNIGNLGAWTLYDGDGMQTFGIQGVDFPNEVLPKAFVVVSPKQMSYDEFYVDVPPADDPLLQPHSGEQYLISFNPDTYYDPKAKADDWLISPRLSSDLQTIGFWAHSFDEYSLETVEVLTSSTGKEVSDFSLIKTCANIPSDWTEYQVQLPEGTQYFAIRVVSADKWALFLDDVSFTPAGSEIKGYNVYRDNSQIGFVSSVACTYTDEDAEAGIHDYAVSVVYEEGESKLSNIVSATTTGIAEMMNPTNCFDVYTIDGIKVRPSSTTLEGLCKGVYIVNGRKVVK